MITFYMALESWREYSTSSQKIHIQVSFSHSTNFFWGGHLNILLDLYSSDKNRDHKELNKYRIY